MTEPHIDSFRLGDDGSIPNNADLPLLIYRGALSGETLTAEGCRALFAGNGWSAGGWVNGIFSHDHYHATAHEVLGVIAGSARVKMGGEDGVETTVAAGDVIVIPAGVGHKNLGASGVFQAWSAAPVHDPVARRGLMNRGEADERPGGPCTRIRPHPEPGICLLCRRAGGRSGPFGTGGPLTEKVWG